MRVKVLWQEGNWQWNFLGRGLMGGVGGGGWGGALGSRLLEGVEGE